MTRQLNTPLFAVAALAAVTFFMIASLISIGPSMDSGADLAVASAPATNG